MIDQDEVRDTATNLGLTEANVQRDYVFGWLLAGIFSESSLGEEIALKGGNALRKGYFADTRFSADLDFTTEGSIRPDALIEQLNAVCRLVQSQTGVEFDLSRNTLVDIQEIDQTKRAYKIRLYFRDFASGSDHITLKIRVDVTEHDRIYLPIQSRQLLHPYSDADECASTIRCIKVEEALADKMKCLLQRRHCFDLFDLVYGVFLTREVAIDKQEVVSVFLRKTIFSPSPPAARQLLQGLPFYLLRKYWDKLVAPARSLIDFDRATELLLSGIGELFAPFGHGTTSALAYYPAELRNPILTAGSERRLVSMTYHGASRLVEPYSLVFKRRRDGVAQEYFFGWDLTGGNSGPGTKTFMHYDIQSLEVTQETFEPRFEISLAKAGDASMTGIFTGSGRRSIGRSRRNAAPFVVVCSACGKRFHRQRPGTHINKHNDEWGSRCIGGTGYYG